MTLSLVPSLGLSVWHHLTIRVFTTLKRPLRYLIRLFDDNFQSQLRTWIHDNPCYLTINCDTGQHSQFLQIFISEYTLSDMSGWICVNLKIWLRSRITSWAKSPPSTRGSSLIFYSAARAGNMEHNPQHGAATQVLPVTEITEEDTDTTYFCCCFSRTSH